MHLAQLMPLILTLSCCSKYRFILPFWYRFNRVVLDKRRLNKYKYLPCNIIHYNAVSALTLLVGQQDANYSSIQSSKCYVMRFTCSKTPVIRDYYLNNEKLQVVSATPYLGIPLRNHLKWNRHPSIHPSIHPSLFVQR